MDVCWMARMMTERSMSLPPVYADGLYSMRDDASVKGWTLDATRHTRLWVCDVKGEVGAKWNTKPCDSHVDMTSLFFRVKLPKHLLSTRSTLSSHQQPHASIHYIP
jgi:hypothetical protein